MENSMDIAKRYMNMPYMEKGQEITYISPEHPMMKEAITQLGHSGCLLQQTAGILVDHNNTIIAKGNNAGILKNTCARQEQGFGSGKGYHLCRVYCAQNGHAEPNTLLNALINLNAPSETIKQFKEFIDLFYYTDGYQITKEDKKNITTFFNELRNVFNINFSDMTFFLAGHWWICNQCWSILVGAGIKSICMQENCEQLYKR